MRDGRVNIEDHLVDSNNRPISASVNFEVRYSSPESLEGTFDSPTVSKFVQQQSLDDDQQMLLNIEQNIANLERSLNQGTYEVSKPLKGIRLCLISSTTPSREKSFRFPGILRLSLGNQKQSNYETKTPFATNIFFSVSLRSARPWRKLNARNLIIHRCGKQKAKHFSKSFGRR